MHTDDASKGECRTAYPIFHDLIGLYIQFRHVAPFDMSVVIFQSAADVAAL